MIRLEEAVVVEGKYDRQRLAEVVDGVILETGGFGIFKDKEKLDMLRLLAQKSGLIILTDSDAAGFKIRHFLHSAIQGGRLVDVYIPDIYGKERRKAAPSKEGKLGVEGIDSDILCACLRRAGVLPGETAVRRTPVTKADLFSWGLSGADGAAGRRGVLLKALGFPELMTTKALLPVLNTLYDRESFGEFLVRLFP